MNRIQRFAKLFRAMFMVFFILVPIVVGSIWLTGGELLLGNDEMEMSLDMFATGHDLALTPDLMPSLPLAWDIRLLGLTVTMLPAGIGILSLWWLIRLFGRFADGEIFTGATVRYIRYLGWTMIAGVIASPIHDALLTLVLTMHNPPGKRLLSVGLESNDIRELVVAGIIILISWIMDEGRKLRETEELTI